MTKFHDDWTTNVTSRGPCFFLPIRTIFELNRRILKTNILTKFHEDWTKNVSSRLFRCFQYIHIEKTAPPPGGHVCPLITTIFKLVRDIHIPNAKNLTYPPPGGHVFLPIRFIFELNRRIQETNVLTKFHEDWAKKEKTAPPLWRPYMHKTNAKNVTSRETNVLTKFHENWAKNVSSRLFTCFHYIHIEKTAPHHGGHETNVLTKFQEDLTKNVTFRVFTCFHYIYTMFFSPIWTIFELVQDINETNLLTKFHDDWAKIVTSRVFTMKTAPPPGDHDFHRIGTIFELNHHIIETNILTKLHEDWASNGTSTVLTSFELVRGIIWTNVLTKFHEDRTRNVASRVFTRQNVDDGRTTDDAQKAILKAHHEHVVLR
ncbi:hypothetical protein DPMN_025054 [Dreissena polymorpha]|uniref:Uncharacterized protein n=1 Tax=Dreissena polymorpha TaxID=45954 RepID=A0A9D4RC75_DREPO|nr:hypothetical protein DPMN_025054 [Dreissena polymorpha]